MENPSVAPDAAALCDDNAAALPVEPAAPPSVPAPIAPPSVPAAPVESAPPAPETPDVLPDDEVLYELADLFRVFGDSTRIKILYALHDTELCVQDIAAALAISQSAVSHQLRILKDSKLVRFRRDGKAIYYALDDDHVRSMLSLGMEHVEE